MDFTGAKLEDFKVAGKEESTQEAEESTEETVEETEDSSGENTEEAETTEVGETEEEPTDETVEEAEEEPTEEEGLSPDISGITEGKFEDAESLWKAFQEKETAPEMDDFIKKAVDYYNETGDLNAYLEAKTVDYKGMSDRDLLKYDLQKKNPSLSDKAIERKYQKEVLQKYGLDEEDLDEDEVAIGEELLGVDAKALREQYIQDQEKFKAPEREEKKEEEDPSKKIEEFQDIARNRPETKQLLKDKRLVIGKEGSTFNYEVENPEAILDATLDADKFYKHFVNDKGEVDYQKFFKVAEYAKDMEKFETSLINHGKSLGTEEFVEGDLKNSTLGKRGNKNQAEGTGSLLEAFKKRKK